MPGRGQGLELTVKIAISGKGGVGKTTLAAALAKVLAAEGLSVTAIDADPDANLAQAFGIVDRRITPLVEMKSLIQERTGAAPGSYGTYFKLNPHVADIPEQYGLVVDGIRLLTLGTIYQGGGGCACPENVFLRALLSHVVLERDEAVVVDMEAGLEHLGRATVMGIDALVVVVEPGLRSLRTASQTVKLAGDIGLRSVYAVGNKVRTAAHRAFLAEGVKGLPLLGVLSYDEGIAAADLEGRPVYVAAPGLLAEARMIRQALAAAREGRGG